MSTPSFQAYADLLPTYFVAFQHKKNVLLSLVCCFQQPMKYVVKIDTEGSEIMVLRSLLSVMGAPNTDITDLVVCQNCL